MRYVMGNENGVPYVAHNVLHEEMHDGHVWITDKKIIQSRTPLKITRIIDGGKTKTIFCEGLMVDEQYKERRNERLKEKRKSFTGLLEEDANRKCRSIMLSAYYRVLLGITEGDFKAKKKIDLDVKKAGWSGRILACFCHPQVAIRMAAWIGCIGGFWSFLGVVCGVLSMMPIESCFAKWTAVIVLVLSSTLFLLGFLLWVGKLFKTED